MLAYILCAIQTLIFLIAPAVSQSIKFQACAPKVGKETRQLFVATCDTRSGWKEFNALKVWNVTGIALRNEGVIMRNVCTGRNWVAHGYLTKPLIYLEFLKTLPKTGPLGGKVYVILMDSDTFWASQSLSAIWSKFDCARGNKDVVLSTEMSCWVGRYCTIDDVHRWYNNTPLTPSYSPFANSGIVMGAVDKVQKMLEYVVAHNKSYYITYVKNKFDDQYAIADYAISVAPEDVALDYHQQLLASFSLHAPGNPPEDGWPFRCKTRHGNISMSCPNWTNLLNRLGHFKVSPSTCLLYRHYWEKMPMQVELESLAVDPVIWHGNGAGKSLYQNYGHASMKCYLQKNMNLTVHEYNDRYGYG